MAPTAITNERIQKHKYAFSMQNMKKIHFFKEFIREFVVLNVDDVQFKGAML